MSRPDATALLQTARQTLFSQLLPALPKELHYEARMMANAMIIAVREQQLGETCAAQEQAHLQTLLNTTDSQRSMQELRAQLGKAIRLGEFDQHDQLSALLLQITHAKLAISNPKAVRN
ncbi:DUF6285 domain-containing protein [Pseudomonas saliphila]|uniref:DUF6285 domain-containing protein n=1 Tax=Pseudomonas saliphila TaxID=2586906 RepID=UPI00123908B8|nr:DUF6285 domain-containing protein [Pseudomonas saliphila]